MNLTLVFTFQARAPFKQEMASDRTASLDGGSGPACCYSPRSAAGRASSRPKGLMSTQSFTEPAGGNSKARNRAGTPAGELKINPAAEDGLQENCEELRKAPPHRCTPRGQHLKPHRLFHLHGQVVQLSLTTCRQCGSISPWGCEPK